MPADTDRLDTAIGTAIAVLAGLLAAPEVRRHWSAPSALPQLSVGALACHLGRQAVRTAELLATPAETAPLGSAAEHYARAAWVQTTSPDDPANDRTTDDAEAGLGYGSLIARVADAQATVDRLLAEGAASEVVPVPWQGWSLRRPDFLLTRLVEIVVHTADLAVSLGLPAPDFPDEVFAPVLDLLARLSVARHGQSAVISALTRSERATSIAAF